MQISSRIFQLMEKKGISQKELSERTGIRQSTISDWKRKGTNPGADKIKTICNALDISTEELLNERDDTDYIITKKGTVDYEIIMTLTHFSSAQKYRVLGYMDALKELPVNNS